MQTTLDRWRVALPVGNNREQRHICDTEQIQQDSNRANVLLEMTQANLSSQPHSNASHISNNTHTNTNTESIQQSISTFTRHRHAYQTQVYGEHMPLKDQNEYRIVCNNIGCLGLPTVGNVKQNNLKDWLIQNEVDIVGWQEIGLSQHMLPKHERLAERMRDYRRRQIRVASSNNRHESIERFQWGGTSVIAFDTLANMSRASGADESGLGRWSWIQLEGHNNRLVRVVSAYNPCRTPTSKFATVYSQHKRYYLTKDDDRCPRLRFRQDLTSLLLKWQLQGESIILLIDCNEDLSILKDLQIHLTTRELKLADPIRAKYQRLDKLPPTNNTGSKPIDSIFVSADLMDISRGGWLEFGEGFSDHRVLYFDISMHLLLGSHKNSTAPKNIRRLQCRDPRTVKRFNDILDKQYTHHNMLERLEEFENTVQFPIQEADMLPLIRLDRLNTQLIRHAEKNCRKLKMGAIPYTPDISTLGLAVYVWRLIEKKREGRKISSRYLRRKANQCGIFNYSIVPTEECRRARAIAFKEYIEYASQAKIKRPAFLDGLADALAATGNISRSSAIRQLKSQEESRHSHRMIRVAIKEFSGAPFHMELIGDKGPFISTDKEEIEKALMIEYENKYRLAESSPFLEEPLLSDLGQLALNDKANAILNGDYECPPGVDQYTQSFIRHLARPQQLQNSKHNEVPISTQCLNSFWKNMDEKVVSSPSGRHIGTYKATSTHEKNSIVQSKFTSLPYELGFPLPRTTQCINVSLLKKGKGITPADLRTIWLMEADLNTGAKLHFVSRMINQTALSNNAIQESQYAKKGSRAIEAALVKILYFDHIRQNKQPGIFFASDLMQCFDRMAHPVCSLVSQRLGVHPSVVQCMLLAVQRMEHRVRTGYGDSNYTYGNDREHPLQGGGQGNGASLPLWLAISCIILSMLESEVIGVQVRTAITLQLVTFIAIMYVDDTDIMLSTLHDNESLQDVFTRTLTAVTIWQEAIRVSGGALRPNKCSWSAIDFRWKDGEWSYMAASEFQEEIWVKDTNNTLKKVKRKDIDDSNLGLGLHINPDGSMKLQYEHVMEKITTYTSKLQPSSISKHHAIISANTGIFRSIIYSLPGCAFSEKQCSELEASLYKVLLPKIGVNGKLPLAYRHSTHMFQGLEMLHIHSQMMMEQLKLFITHIAKDTQLGIMYRATLESMKLEIGSLQDIFSLSYWPHSYLATHSWLKVLWYCTDHYGITLLKANSSLPKQRDGDISLMDSVIACNLYTIQEIRQINNCRLYLQVLYLSDIASGDGRLIMHHYVMGRTTPARVSKWKWPRQGYPSATAWNLWRHAIENVWKKYHNNRFHLGLGNWINDSHQTFQYNYDSKHDTVIHTLDDGQMIAYTRTSQRTRQSTTFTKSDKIISPRRRWIPVIAEQISDIDIAVETNIESIHRFIPPQPTSLQEYVQLYYPHFLDIVRFAHIQNDGKDFAEAFHFKPVISVTDASVSTITNTSAVSWTIRSNYKKVLAEGTSGCPPFFTPQDSYGAEMFGILDILIVTQMIVEYHAVSSGTLIIACDNDASLASGTNATAITKHCQKYFDIIWSIQNVLRSLPITIISKRVKGHADKTKLVLNRFEKLNVLMDERAKEFRSQIEHSMISHSPTLLDPHQYSIWIHDHRVSCDIDYSIKSHIHGNKMKLKLDEKGDLSSAAFDLVDWYSIAGASKSLTISEKLWLTKFVSGFSPTASQMYYRECSKAKRKKHQKTVEEEINTTAPWNDDTCPLCNIHRENTKHVLVCMNDGAVEHRKQAISEFEEWLTVQRTNPTIITCFIRRMKEEDCQTYSDAMNSISSDSIDLKAASEQDLIGHTNFLFGRLSRFWKESQRRYLSSMYPTKNYSADAWMKRLLCKLYRTVKSLWQYRCEQVHGIESVLTSKREKKELQREIKLQYQIGTNGLRVADKHLLTTSMTSILHASTKEQKYWVRTIKISRAYVQKRENNMFIGMRHVMKTWTRPPD